MHYRHTIFPDERRCLNFVGRDVGSGLSTGDAEGIDGRAIGEHHVPRSKLSPRLWKGVSPSSLKSVIRLSRPTNPPMSRESAAGISARTVSTGYEIVRLSLNQIDRCRWNSILGW